jgi:hypothetical protein
MNEDKKDEDVTRQLIPVILNGRTVLWLFEAGKKTLTIQMPMRKYVDRMTWEPKFVDILFTLKTRPIGVLSNRVTKSLTRVLERSDDDKENYDGIVQETYYDCHNPRVRFEEGKIPVIM